MKTDLDRSTLRRRLELGRLLGGSLVEMLIKAYGAGAALAVALSDSETVGGKSRDAITAVPTLADEYRQARYVVEHREEIQSAIDYVNQNTPPQAELQASADESVETLREIESTYGDVGQALDALPLSPLEALGHARDAWNSRPDLDSIRDLADMAERVGPYVEEAEVLGNAYYGGMVTLADNFASDEIAGTVFVMVLAFVLSVALGHAVGFWIRRGRPGLIAHALQWLGARTFQKWYVDNLPYALSPPLYAAARERVHRDLVADLEDTLDAEALREIDRYFEDRDRVDSS